MNASKVDRDASADRRIKELGRKARERLEAENQKRREVVRLDTSALPKPPPSPAPSKKKKKNLRNRQSADKKSNDNKTDTNAKTVNIPAIPTTTSSIVCVQGFPDDVATVGHVKRFLSGIDALVVYVPLFKIHIESNDQSPNHGKKRKRKHNIVATNDGSVLVRLPSPSIAALAVARSGEPAVGIENDNHSQEGKLKVRVSEVPSNVFERLQSLLITAWKGATLNDIRSSVLTALHPSVEPILRYYYQSFLQEREGNSIKKCETVQHIPGLRKGDLDQEQPYDEMREERIQNLRDGIRYQLPFLDFGNDSDPVAHLSREAVLLLEARRLEPLRSDRIRRFRLAYL